MLTRAVTPKLVAPSTMVCTPLVTGSLYHRTSKWTQKQNESLKIS
jgi:hypothetical protein